MSRISEEEYRKALLKIEEKERKDPKRKWVGRMMRSAKQYYKLCPYYDKKTGECFQKKSKEKYLNLGTPGTRCDREGRFDNCPVFIAYIEDAYDEIAKRGLQLPMDFQDLSLMAI